MFFHSSTKFGGSSILLGWITGGGGGNCPGYRLPLYPLNSGNFFIAVIRIMMLKRSLNPKMVTDDSFCLAVQYFQCHTQIFHKEYRHPDVKSSFFANPFIQGFQQNVFALVKEQRVDSQGHTVDKVQSQV